MTEVEVWTLAATEYRRLLGLLRSLEGDDWSRDTDCTAWTVRDLLGHLVGAAEGFARPRELLHQYRSGRRLIKQGRSDGGQPVDGANAVQIVDRRAASVDELLRRYEAVVDPVIRWRRRLRHLPVSMRDVAGRFTFRQLFEVILTRDTWIHRLDIARATGRPFAMTRDHDGLLVADMVRDWARHHGQPFRLNLTGPAGGRYQRGAAAEELELEDLEFARILSGRAAGQGLLARRIVF